jgi:aminoglycoside phosphotransferase (APT) family kinase protein
MAGPIRQPIDLKSLESYLQKQVPEIKIPLDVKQVIPSFSCHIFFSASRNIETRLQFGYGQSNPTYLLTASDKQQYVLRKKPPGNLLSKTAHKVEREYRILHALETTDVPVPKTYCLCEDDSIIGTAFYVMEFLDGRIIENPCLPHVSPEHRRDMWRSAVTTLAKFHRVDPASVNLASYGKPKAFYNRQLATFHTIQDAQAKAVDIESNEPVGKIPHYDDMVAFFGSPDTQPQDRSSFVHGDYKIDNVVFHKTEPRVIGILE